MKHLILSAVLASALSLPAAAQESDRPPGGLNLFEEGAQGLLRGLLSEIEPQMRDFAEEMEPRLRGLAEGFAPLAEDLADLMDDLQMYEMPERLPNGDIIIRRKPPREQEQDRPQAQRQPEAEAGPIDL